MEILSRSWGVEEWIRPTGETTIKNNDAKIGTSRVRWKSYLESKEKREVAGEDVEVLRIILRGELGNGEKDSCFFLSFLVWQHFELTLVLRIG